MMICASEDVGNADPYALTVAVSASQAVERIGMPEAQIILAQAPMSEVQKYVIDLKAMTQGRGKFTMTLDHYEEVPKSIADEIIKKNGGNN